MRADHHTTQALLVGPRITPELSRAALRPWVSETCKNLHEAAKRARLERIVSSLPAVAFDRGPVIEPSLVLTIALCEQVEPRNGVPAALAGTEFVARIKCLREACEERNSIWLDAR